jgi:DNA (cytosine-5)-methyltransferase 1
MIFDERPPADPTTTVQAANSRLIAKAAVVTPPKADDAPRSDNSSINIESKQPPVETSEVEQAKELASEKGARLLRAAKKIRKARSTITRKMLEIADLLEETRTDLKKDDGDDREDTRRTQAAMRAFAHVEAGMPRDEINTYLRLSSFDADERAVLKRQGSGFAVLKAILSDTGLRQDVVDRMSAGIPMDIASVRHIRRQRKLAAETPLFTFVRREPGSNRLAGRKELAAALKAFETDTIAFVYKLADLASAVEISDEDYQIRCQELSPMALELLQRVATLIDTKDMAQDWVMLWAGGRHTDCIAEALLALQSIAFEEYFIRDELDGGFLETDDVNVDQRLVDAIARLVALPVSELLQAGRGKPSRRRIPAQPKEPKLIKPQKGLRSIEICAGAGGQALGLHAAGFHARAIFEWEKDAAETLKQHFQSAVNRVFSEDIRRVDFSLYKGGVDLVAGGVPCQSFSSAGLRKGENDDRDLFRRAVEIVDEIQPRAFFFENVKGFAEATNIAYRSDLHAAFEAIGYQSRIFPIFGTSYGLAQERPRIVFVGFRDTDAMARFRMPPAFPQWETSLADAIGDLVSANGWKGYDAWRTIADQKCPTIVGGSRKSAKFSFSSGYTFKTWKLLGIDGSDVAKTAPGPNDTGLFKLTLGMGARLQGFPDGWRFQGEPKQIKSQIGNAFPPIMAKAVGLAIHAALENIEFDYEQALKIPFTTPPAPTSRKNRGSRSPGKFMQLNGDDGELRRLEHEFFGEIEYGEYPEEDTIVGPGEFSTKLAPGVKV